MKTLSINPFNFKQVKGLLRRQKHVEIPTTLAPELYSKLVGLQGSLDYMATNLGININIRPSHNSCIVECNRQMANWYNTIIYANENESKIVSEIYKAASLTYPQKPDIYETAKKKFNVNR